jgi:hypothetical protein
MAKIISLSESQIKHIPAVPATATWNPVHHSLIIDELEAACLSVGLDIVTRRYEASEDGRDLFATWRLPVNREDGVVGHRDAPTIGWRNSMKKRFALGFAAGNHVLVCSNMCIWGDFVEHRKHTVGLTVEALREFIGRALQTIIERTTHYRQWFQRLAGLPLGELDRKLLVYDMMEQGILTPSHFGKFQQAWAEELRDNQQGGGENFAHLHGAVTRTLRGLSIAQIQDRTRAMNRLIETHLDEFAENIIDVEFSTREA